MAKATTTKIKKPSTITKKAAPKAAVKAPKRK